MLDRSRFVKGVLASAMILLLSGCAVTTGEGINGDNTSSAIKLADSDAKAQQDQGPDVKPSIPGVETGYILPTLQQGDSFTFDTPMSTWHVDAVKNGKVYWSGDHSGTQVTSLNPLFPALSWSSQVMGSGTRKIGNIHGTIFPLKEGGHVSFQTIVTSSKASGLATFYWSCTAVSSQQTTVPAGTFETVKVRCERQGSGVWTFYYAPKIGYYVRVDHVDAASGQTSTRRLVAFNRPSLHMSVSNDLKYNDQNRNSVSQGQSSSAMTGRSPLSVVSPSSSHNMTMTGKQGDTGIISHDWQNMYGIHVVSFKDKNRVRAGYQDFVRQYKGILGSHVMPFIEQANVPQRGGVFYRVVVGAMSKEKARSVCDQIRSQGVSFCRVTSLAHATPLK